MGLMRRGLSLLLAMFFSLGPLMAAIQAEDESRLPACCRRHGLHHCTMVDPAAAMAESQERAFGAPAHCPLFPQAIAVCSEPTHALIARAMDLPTLAPLTHATAPEVIVRSTSTIQTHEGRGPPADSPL
jgi:hypothetical protein